MKATARCVIFALLCTLGVGQSPSPSNSNHTDWVLRFDGIGPVKVGMTLRQVNVALGEAFSLPSDKDEQTCFYVEPKQHPDVGIMMLEGRVGRVEVFQLKTSKPGTATVSGIRVGDPESRVKQVYGDGVAVGPHHYDPDGHYLYLQSGKYGLRFETDGKEVTSFYAGTLAAVAFVEGCS